jgi:5-methyltetrahydrofolate--homocysteine methyltransferase
MNAAIVDQLRDALARRVLVLDGAMATLLGADGAGGYAVACDRLSVTQPSRVRAVHDAYLAAGADIISTNTFAAASLDSAPRADGHDARALCASAARLARAAADEWTTRAPQRPRFVAGALGPTGSTGVGASRGDARAAYRAPLIGLLEGGVDIVLLETWYSPDDLGAALEALAEAADLVGRAVPAVVSITLDRNGRLPISGAGLEDALARIASHGVFGVGLNCGSGAGTFETAIHALAAGPWWVCCHPSAGLPDAAGDYPEGPGTFASQLAGYAAAGLVNIVGGCCGTTPAHIRALADAVSYGSAQATSLSPGAEAPVGQPLQPRVQPGHNES